MIDAADIDLLMGQLPLVVRHDDLARAWSELADKLKLDPTDGMETVVAVPRDLTLRHEGRSDSAWGGAWEWNLVDGVMRTAVVSVLLAATLAAAGAGTGLAPVIIPTIVPLLFDLRRVRMERTADHYLQIIGARRELADRVGSLEELYASLSPQLKKEVSQRELLEFLGMAVEAGRAHAGNGTFEVLPNGETAFRIHIR